MISNRNPLVSVVIPSYNYERFLPDCVRSVASQDYEHVELIVVDDVSRDRSFDLARDFAMSDEFKKRFSGRVLVEQNERNLGAHATINAGIARSKGAYVTVLNADDTFDPSRIRVMIRKMQSNSSRFAFSRVEFINEHGEPFSVVDPDMQKLKRRQTSIPHFPTIGFACLASNVAISTGNFLFERTLFDEVGPFRDLKYCHDWDFLLRTVLLTEPLYVGSTVYNYRIHGKNTFRSLGDVAASDTAAVYRQFFSAITRKRYRNPIAPNPESWPSVYELFLDAYGLWKYLR
jgi:glycosyltransferase involved in cell wall biosynthesis